MSTTSRQENSSITKNLVEKTSTYSFIQVVRLLERSRAFDSVSIEDVNKSYAVARFMPPGNEVVRFHTNQKLDFFSSEVSSVYRNLKKTNSSQWHILVNMFGLTGSSGVLPYHYTELILQRLKIKDNSLKDFFDLFNHRTISLFFQASIKYRLPIEYERNRLNSNRTDKKDLHTKALLALIGLGTKNLTQRLYTDDESLLYYSGLFTQQVKTASGLQQILQRHFSIPVEIKEFVGQWQDLIDDVRTRLTSKALPKGQNASLSRSAILGRKGWYAQGKIRIILGPLDTKQLGKFAPGTTTLKSINEIVLMYAGIECNYDFVIRVKQADIPKKLTLSKESPPVLSWNTWLPKSDNIYDKNKTVDIVVSPARLI